MTCALFNLFYLIFILFYLTLFYYSITSVKSSSNGLASLKCYTNSFIIIIIIIIIIMSFNTTSP